MEIVALDASELSIPLLEPFAIATGTMVATRSVLVRARVRARNRVAAGLGEAAALPPVTDCDQPELLAWGAALARDWSGFSADGPEALAGALAERIASPVLRAGVEAAVLDGWARAEGRPVFELLGGTAPALELVTDITIPIGEPAHMAELARQHHARGFSVFKVKVGRDLDADLAALHAIAAAVPGARFRIDANGGYSESGARALLAGTDGLAIECFEQPCARGDDDAMAALARATRIPIVADESLRASADLDRILAKKSASGVNLKLAKLGGLVRATEIGRRAQDAGLALMCGAMVETRLGLTAMAHVAAALGGAEWIDLDTQLLLARERFRGGYAMSGPRMTIVRDEGLGVWDEEERAE